jgi:hypothetical protein
VIYLFDIIGQVCKCKNAIYNKVFGYSSLHKFSLKIVESRKNDKIASYSVKKMVSAITSEP